MLLTVFDTVLFSFLVVLICQVKWVHLMGRIIQDRRRMLWHLMGQINDK